MYFLYVISIKPFIKRKPQAKCGDSLYGNNIKNSATSQSRVNSLVSPQAL